MENYAEKFKELLTRLQVVISEIDYNQKACIQAGKMECQLLNYLHRVQKPVNMNELAKALAVSHSRVTRIMDNLVNKGLVTRRPSEEDRRCWYAEITGKGAKLAENSQQTIIDQQQKLIKLLPKNQLESIYQAFSAYVDAYEKVMKESYVEI